MRNLKELYLSGIDVDSVSPVVRTYYNETHHKNENGDWEGQDEALLLNLEKLDISYINRNEESYVSMPTFSELSYLENLNSLYMQGNNIDSVYEIYLLHNLKEVNLEQNKIEDLSRFSKYKY